VRSVPPPAPFASWYSFSALANGARALGAEERAASDEGEPAPTVHGMEIVDLAEAESAAPAPAHPELAGLAPLAGIEFGHAVHAIFERRAIGVPLAAQHALVRDCLRDEGVRLGELDGDEVVRRLADRLQATLDVLLPVTAADPPCLGALPAAAQVAEMSFGFVLDEVSLVALRRACDFVPDAPAHVLRGFMSGTIDLVFEHAGRFHVLDYKSNRLGDGRQLAAYAPAALERTMDLHHYRFQALLYTVAVDRYLRQRLPHYRRAGHLGETIYLFVRASGIDPRAPRAGIWTHRFDDALLDAVDRVLAGCGDAA
jgi:exodeoxyribonuclease V beta subunit